MPDVEYKAFREFKLLDGDAGGFEGYPSDFGVLDDGGDIVEPGAYTDTIPGFLKNGFISYGHDYGRLEIGVPVHAEQDGRGLFLRAEYHDTPEAQAARRVAQKRLARGMSVPLSIGYFVPPGGASVDENGHRHLRRIELLEVAQVPLPMLRTAGLTAVKAAELEGKPFANEHACRLRSPDAFQADSFRRVTREHDGKTYAIIMGRLKGESAMTEQAYRYPFDQDWTEAQARAHCKDHDGILFEPASGGKGDCAPCGEKDLLIPADGFDLSFDDHSERVRVAASEWVARCRSGSDARRKEGRAISEARRSRIAAMRDALRGHADELHALLEETEPRPKALEPPPDLCDGSDLYAEFLRIDARLHGVAV